MATRKRFRRDEIDTFVSGTAVEWLNATTWLSGMVTSGPAHTDGLGLSYMLIRNTTATRTVSRGEIVRGYPGRVRVPAERVVS